MCFRSFFVDRVNKTLANYELSDLVYVIILLRFSTICISLKIDS